MIGRRTSVNDAFRADHLRQQSRMSLDARIRLALRAGEALGLAPARGNGAPPEASDPGTADPGASDPEAAPPIARRRRAKERPSRPLATAASALREQGIPFALVGGLAMAAHGAVALRGTRIFWRVLAF